MKMANKNDFFVNLGDQLDIVVAQKEEAPEVKVEPTAIVEESSSQLTQDITQNLEISQQNEQLNEESKIPSGMEIFEEDLVKIENVQTILIAPDSSLPTGPVEQTDDGQTEGSSGENTGPTATSKDFLVVNDNSQKITKEEEKEILSQIAMKWVKVKDDEVNSNVNNELFKQAFDRKQKRKLLGRISVGVLWTAVVVWLGGFAYMNQSMFASILQTQAVPFVNTDTTSNPDSTLALVENSPITWPMDSWNIAQEVIPWQMEWVNELPAQETNAPAIIPQNTFDQMNLGSFYGIYTNDYKLINESTIDETTKQNTIIKINLLLYKYKQSPSQYNEFRKEYNKLISDFLSK